MASNTVRVNVVGDSSKLQQAFGQGATAGEKFKARLELVAKAAVAALAIKALGAVKDFVGDSVRAFSDLNESMNALEVTYGENAEGIKTLGEEAAQSLGLSNAEFNMFAVQMSAFAHQIAGDGGDVVAVVDELSTRVSDFASVMNLEVAEAARLFQSGLAGETEPLRRYGIDLSAAAVQAHALAVGIAAGNDPLSEQEKVLARHSLLMEQTDKVAGDFANTSDELANKERIVNAELENSKALFGEIIAPLKTVSLEMQGGIIESLNDAAIALGGMTGALSDGEAALLSFKNETGETATTVADVVKGVDLAWQSWTHEIDVWADTLFGGTRRLDDMVEGIRTLIDTEELGAEGMIDLRKEVEKLGRAGELTEEEVAALTEAINEEMVAHSNAARDAGRHRQAADDLEPAITDLTEAEKEQAEATEDVAAAHYDHAAAINAVIEANKRAASPALQALKAAKDLEEAQIAYNEALGEFGPGSDEAIEAAGGLIEAQGDLDAALAQIVEDAGPNWRAEFRRVAQQAGVAEDDIDAMIAKVEQADGMSATVTVETETGQAQDALDRWIANNSNRSITVPVRTSGGSGIIRSHSGEVIPGPPHSEHLRILEAGEEVIPANGHRGNGSSTGTSVQLVFSGSVYGLDDLEQRVLEMIERARRRGIAV